MSNNHYFVNWVDGMKLNKAHFVAEENAFVSKLTQTASTLTASYNYGLLPPRTGNNYLNVKLEVDRAKFLRVLVQECHAVTPAGVIINITDDQPYNSEQEINGLLSEVSVEELSNGKSYFVAISVNPYAKRSFGELDPNENPPRFPKSDFAYSINLIPADSTDVFENGSYHVSLGKFTVVPNGIEIDETYVPPCTSCLSHPDLIDVSRDLSAVLSTMESASVSVVQNIFEKDQTNELPQTVRYLLENVVAYLSAHIYTFRWQVPEQPPIALVQVIAGLARTIKNSVDSKGKAGKELMLNYFRSWVSEISQAEFEEIVDDMVNTEYSHNDINGSLEKILTFCNMFTSLLKKLDELEFIGDKKVKSGPVVDLRRKEDVDNDQHKPKKRSFLAD